MRTKKTNPILLLVIASVVVLSFNLISVDAATPGAEEFCELGSLDYYSQYFYGDGENETYSIVGKNESKFVIDINDTDSGWDITNLTGRNGELCNEGINDACSWNSVDAYIEYTNKELPTSENSQVIKEVWKGQSRWVKTGSNPWTKEVMLGDGGAWCGQRNRQNMAFCDMNSLDYYSKYYNPRESKKDYLITVGKGSDRWILDESNDNPSWIHQTALGNDGVLCFDRSQIEGSRVFCGMDSLDYFFEYFNYGVNYEDGDATGDIVSVAMDGTERYILFHEEADPREKGWREDKIIGPNGAFSEGTCYSGKWSSEQVQVGTSVDMVLDGNFEGGETINIEIFDGNEVSVNNSDYVVEGDTMEMSITWTPETPGTYEFDWTYNEEERTSINALTVQSRGTGINSCSGYGPEKCERDPLNVAGSYESDSCTYDEECVWNGEDEECITRTTQENPDDPACDDSIGSCDFTSSTDGSCEDGDEFFTIEYEQVGDSNDCSSPPDKRVSCLNQVKLPFFGGQGFVASALLIMLIYGIAIFKKSRS